MGLVTELAELRPLLPPAMLPEADRLSELASFDEAVVRACDTPTVRAVTKLLAAHPLGAYVAAYLSRRASWMSGASAARGVLTFTVKQYGDEGYLALAWLAALPGEPPQLHVLLSHLLTRVERGGDAALPIDRLAPAVVAGLTHRSAPARIAATKLVRALGQPIRPFLVAARASSSASRKRLFDAHLLELARALEADAPRDRASDAQDPLPLRRALQHAEARDYAGVALALREEWEGSRSPRVAELCELASASVPVEVPVLPTRRAASSHWEALAERGDPASVPTLLAAPWPEDVKEAVARATLLGRFPPDPRIAGAALALLEEGRYRVFRGLVAEEALLALLVAHADPRSSQRLPPVLERLARYRDAASRPRLRLLDGSLLKDALAALRVVPALDAPRELEAIREALRGAPAEVHEALVAAVYADLDDDAPRAVLADFLAERGDPRGELIQLQLRLEDSAATERPKLEKRVVTLLHALRSRWCDPLRGLRSSSARFRRGFVEEGELDLRGDWTGNARAFATLRRVVLGAVEAPVLVRRLLAAESFGRLQVLYGVPPAVFGPDDPGPWAVPVRVEHGSLVELGLHDDRVWRDLDLVGLIALRRLVVPSLSVLTRAVLPASLSEIAVFVGYASPNAELQLQAVVGALPRSVERVTVHLGELPFAVEPLPAVQGEGASGGGFALERGPSSDWQRSTF